VLQDAGKLREKPADVLPDVPAFDRPATRGVQYLASKYRPRCLAEVLGQAEAAASLKAFAAAPYPAPFLFHRHRRTRNTSAAHALANDLGCAGDAGELGGLLEIASGIQTVESVKDKLHTLRYRPMCGTGWRVLIVNECDRMSSAVETLWLDALENLPECVVVVFTTNDPDKLSRRFRDPCEGLRFRSVSKELSPWVPSPSGRGSP